MDREMLYKMLDIEEPADFQYFENLAELLECDEHIEYEDLYSLLKEVDKEILAQLIHDYFEEVSDFVPQDAAELFLLLDKIKLSLIGMVRKLRRRKRFVQFDRRTEQVQAVVLAGFVGDLHSGRLRAGKRRQGRRAYAQRRADVF
ncbi:MAG: hypothetical protein ACLTK0_07325 [Anaerovoracaceae bacterium]